MYGGAPDYKIWNEDESIEWDLIVYAEGGENMDVTTKEYVLLFNTISDMIQKLDAMKTELIFAQQRAEEIVICKEESDS